MRSCKLKLPVFVSSLVDWLSVKFIKSVQHCRVNPIYEKAKPRFPTSKSCTPCPLVMSSVHYFFFTFREQLSHNNLKVWVA